MPVSQQLFKMLLICLMTDVLKYLCIKGCVEKTASCLLGDDVMRQHWHIRTSTQHSENFILCPCELSQ